MANCKRCHLLAGRARMLEKRCNQLKHDRDDLDLQHRAVWEDCERLRDLFRSFMYEAVYCETIPFVNLRRIFKELDIRILKPREEAGK